MLSDISDGAVLTIVSGLVTIATMVVGFLTMWVKLRYGTQKADEAATRAMRVETKVDENTRITKEGTEVAAENAKTAASFADRARVAAETITEQLNGGLEKKITTIVKDQISPVTQALRDHADHDDKNMQEIRQALTELKDQVKVSNPKNGTGVVN